MKSILYTLIGLCIIGAGLAYEITFISALYFICSNEWILLGMIVVVGSFIVGDRIRRYGFVNINVDESNNEGIDM